MIQNNEYSYKLGLALSGGGAKGLAHLGVLRALEEKQIKPNIISGTSAGALAGALYADGHKPEEILSYFEKKAFNEFAAFSIPQGGIFKMDKLKQFLKKHLRAQNFEDLKIPLRIVATDIENGTSVIFEKGPLIPAVLASCAFPIVFTPVEIDGCHYIDGGLFKNFPVSTIKKDCEITIGINVTPLTKHPYRNSFAYVAERSFHYVSLANAIPDRKLCNILIEPKEVSEFAMFTLDHTKEIYDIGYKTAIIAFEKDKYIPFWNHLTTIQE